MPWEVEALNAEGNQHPHNVAALGLAYRMRWPTRERAIEVADEVRETIERCRTLWRRMGHPDDRIDRVDLHLKHRS